MVDFSLILIVNRFEVIIDVAWPCILGTSVSIISGMNAELIAPLIVLDEPAGYDAY